MNQEKRNRMKEKYNENFKMNKHSSINPKPRERNIVTSQSSTAFNFLQDRERKKKSKNN